MPSFLLSRLTLLTVCTVAFACLSAEEPERFSIQDLRTNHLSEPKGLGHEPLSFSWQIASSERGVSQEAYRIRVYETPASFPPKLVWNSGRVASNDCVAVPYHGPDLVSASVYRWELEVWTEQNLLGKTTSLTSRENPLRAASHFETGLLREEDWRSAQWIGAKSDLDSLKPSPAPLLRRSFRIEKKVLQARLYLCGLGYFQAAINGEPVSDHLLDPVVTHYDRSAKYLVFDVGIHLQPGENTLGVVLGNGWFNHHAHAAWDFDQAPWRANPRLIALLLIAYEDGSHESIVSDERWRWAEGPIQFDSIRNGTHYDARAEIPDWDRPGFDDSDWGSPKIVSTPTRKLTAQLMPPTRVIKRLPVAQSREISPQIDVYDFGINTSGRAHLKVRGAPGDSLTLRYGERLLANGRLDNKEVGRFIRTGEPQTDHYIIGPSGVGEFDATFMYHGFQYIEIETSSDHVNIEDIEAQVIHTDLQTTGGFESSNPLFNQIYAASRNSFLSNYHSYPTDCPHREKIGWTGDAQLVMDFGLFHFDTIRAYRKWLDDMVDAQRPNGDISGIIPTSGWGYQRRTNTAENHETRGYGPQWSGVCISLPWNLYLKTGDVSILQRYYPLMSAYFGYLEKSSSDGLLLFGIDDHKSLDPRTEASILSTAYYYWLAGIMQATADRLGQREHAERYQALAQRVRAAYNQTFLSQKIGIYGNGSQASQAITLAFDLAPPSMRPFVIDKLIQSIEETDFHAVAGVVGIRALVDALPYIGRSDLLYAMANRRSYPSWGWWIEQGATTLWQNWDGKQSRNHIMFGSINDYFVENLAGIQVDPKNPGFQHFFVLPELQPDLRMVSAWHNSPYGRLSSSWHREGTTFVLEIEVPANASATVQVPHAPHHEVKESGQKANLAPGVDLVNESAMATTYHLQSGSYRFEAEIAEQ